jgi:hypothetical protein
MRLWHLVLTVALVAAGLTLARDPITRVLMLTLATGLGEVFFGLMTVMALFQTLGALGEAKGLYAHVEALAATTVVLAVGTAVMSGWLFIGFAVVAALV